MEKEINLWPKDYWPRKLKEINDPPKRLFIRGKFPDPKKKILCIIGSRKYSDYGERVCRKIIDGLRNYPIIIVSGLAYGIDSLAHKFALENNLETVAFPGSGLDDRFIYPKKHFGLAKKILENGGSLISEFDNNQPAQNWTFPARNRLMAGISEAVLIIEAKEKSGTMITARLALDYNRDVMTVPGSIYNENSFGTNKLIKEGAHPITNSSEILEILGIKEDDSRIRKQNLNLTETEKMVLEKIGSEIEKTELLALLNIDIIELNRVLTSLEILELIKVNHSKICKN